MKIPKKIPPALKRIIFLTICSALYLWYYHSLWFFLQDDAYIFLRYANNILRGMGPVYNPGEYTEGVTSVSWTYLTAMGLFAGFNPEILLKVVGALSGVLCLPVFYSLCRSMYNSDRISSVLTLLYAFNPTILLWSGSGLETPFFQLILLLFYRFLYNFQSPVIPRYSALLTGVFGALLIWTRPEAPLFIFFGLYWLIYIKRFVLFSPAIIIPVVAFLLLLSFRHFYYDDWVPNTYYAKGAGGIWLFRKGLAETVHAMSQYGFIVFIPFAFISTLLPQLRRSFSLLLLSSVLAFTLYFCKVGGDILQFYRLYAPGYLIWLLLFGNFTKVLEEVSSFSRRNMISVVSLSFVATLGTLLYYVNFIQISFSGHNYVVPALNHTHGAIGEHIQANSNTGDKVVLTDAGLTAWRCPDLEVIDFLGLCNRTTAHFFYDNGYNPWTYFYCADRPDCIQAKATAQSQFIAYFREKNPRYVVCNLYVKDKSEAADTLHSYTNTKLPDSLNGYILNHISFEGYHGVFREKDLVEDYFPVLIREYSPTFYLILLEKSPTPSGLPKNF
jgi:hypothetical protein